MSGLSVSSWYSDRFYCICRSVSSYCLQPSQAANYKFKLPQFSLIKRIKKKRKKNQGKTSAFPNQEPQIWKEHYWRDLAHQATNTVRFSTLQSKAPSSLCRECLITLVMNNHAGLQIQQSERENEQSHTYIYPAPSIFYCCLQKVIKLHFLCKYPNLCCAELWKDDTYRW